MDCKKVRDIIMTDYIDGELDAAAKAAVDGHLKGCTGCSELLAALSGALEPLRGASPGAPPASVWVGVKEAFDNRGVQKEYVGMRDVLSIFSTKWLSAAAMVSALAFTLLTGMYFTNRSLAAQASASEITEAMGFSALNDVPSEETQTVYTNFIGG